ncbi:hypothetical protein [Amycolatopsis jiangsuensis]|uniref:Uncharacterized protein n=1 Tax=Amycolatopsis jiangsuensis TaxID=1181879 RepID=A0A840IXD7_9PSEU|nr:hypothetical protein [Amycolatopsis jiangsuensis]MBB4686159.1 hypothetical protein [Amycolatopsis jiangsuensis]
MATRLLTEGRPVRMPDGFGAVLAWLWHSDANAAVLYLAELMKHLRERHPLARTVEQPLRFDEVLAAARAALPADFDQGDLLIRHVRTSLGDWYGGAPD